jgi:hypothetical protein
MELIFYKARGKLLDGAIRWKTWGPYSHCELRLEQHLTFSSSYRDGGVRYRDMSIDPAKWDRLIVDLPTPAADLLMKWTIRQHGNYDLWGILGFVFGKSIENTAEWYCSEICVDALNRYLDLDLPRHISPNALYQACIRQPQYFRPPTDQYQPFESRLSRPYLEAARELSRDIMELPDALESVEMTKLQFSDPVLHAVVRSLIKANQGWG